MTVSAITEANLQEAAAKDDLDAACLLLQNIAKIEDGGVAGMVFSGSELDWPTASHDERLALLRHWIEVENLYE